MSKIVKSFEVMICSLVGITVLISAEPAHHYDLKMELVDSLETAIASGWSIAPFDLIGTSHQLVEFHGETATFDTTRFRLQLDTKAGSANWAVENTIEVFPVGAGVSVPRPQRTVNLNSAVVRGETCVTSSGPTFKTSHTYDSFEEALSNDGIPLPMYWGVFVFPHFGNAPFNFKRFVAGMLNADTKVSTSINKNYMSIAYKTSPGHDIVAITRWVFELPSYKIIGVKSDLGLTGSLNTDFEELIEWKAIRGIDVPVRISLRGVAARKVGDGYEVGSKTVDTDIVWLRVRKEDPAVAADLNLTSLVDITKFIDDGVVASKGAE